MQDEPEAVMPTGKKPILSYSNRAHPDAVIGGVPYTEQWKSTAQAQGNGDPTERPGARTKKFAPNSQPLNVISPITGDIPENLEIYARKKQIEDEAIALAKFEEEEDLARMQETVHPLLQRLRSDLASRGASGILGLAKKFKIMDDDGSKTLCRAEFRKAMRETKLNLTDQDITTLFQLFGESLDN